MAPIMNLTVGGHVSSAGGPLKALVRAQELGFNTMQIHPTAPQSWAKPTVTPEDAALFAKNYPEIGIRSVFFHNIYLTNFASENPATRHGAVDISKSYLTLGAQMKAVGTVTHLGSHKGAGMESVLETVVGGIRKVLDNSPSESAFIVENTAGAGGTIGRSLEEIEMILETFLPNYSNVGICIDTCHAFCSGIPIHTAEGLEDFIQEFKKRFGLALLKSIHLNDSKCEFASNKDRHENIGDGFIGSEAFGRILHHPDLQNIPFIMEVPGIENKGPDKENLTRVLALAS